MKIKRLTITTSLALGLAWLARAVVRCRGWFLYPQLLLFAACVFYTAHSLKLDNNRGNLIGSNQTYHKNTQRFKKEFPNQEDLVTVVQSEDPNKNRRFVECLGARLETESNLFRNVFFRGDLKMLGSKALLFVPEAELVQLKKKLAEDRPFIQQFTSTTNLVSLFALVNRQFRTAKRELNCDNKAMVEAFPALERITLDALTALKSRGVPVAPGINALFSSDGNTNDSARNAAAEAEQKSYITFANGKIYLVTAQARSAELNNRAVERMRTLIEQTKSEVPGVNVGLTGETVLEHDEMQQSQKDTTLASIIALVLCGLIFVYGYNETERPVKATACLVVGIGYTLGFATLSVGHLNVLTITFVPILIGLAIDYGVHLISRYEEELRRGNSGEEAITTAMIYTGQGIFTGALTTGGAFLAMSLTHFKGIQEMGIICGGGLLLSLIPMMTMLPVLLLRGRHVVTQEHGDRIPEARARLENIWLQRPVLVICLTLALCALAGTQIRKLRFDYNLLHMQSAGLPAVELEKKLLDSADKSLLFGAVIAGDQQEASAMLARLTNLPSVASVESLTGLFSDDQTAKLQLVGEIKTELAPISFCPPDLQPVNLPDLAQTLYALYGYLGFAYDDVEKEDPSLAAQFISLRRTVNRLHRQMLDGTAADRETNALKLAAFQRALFGNITETFLALKNQDATSPLRPEDLPDAIRHRFVGITGKHLLMVYAKKDLRERANQKEFIEQVQTVYPNVCGAPVQLYYYTEQLKRSYEDAARYSLVAIVLLVLFHFRSLLCVVLALIPVAVGSLWLAGVMGCFNIPLNPANIMILPLVIGIGVTNGIQVLNRYAEEQTPNILARSTGKAVLVSGLTSIAGFGSLVVGKHQGIQSLGYVMSCGIGACMIAGLTFLPALLAVLSRNREAQSRPTPTPAPAPILRSPPEREKSPAPAGMGKPTHFGGALK